MAKIEVKREMGPNLVHSWQLDHALRILSHVISGFLKKSMFLLQQARAEQEEEFISNTLFKKIQALQKEKETLAVNYEKEEEFLTNELSRKLMQV